MTDLARCSKCAAYVFRAPDDVIGGVLAVDVVPVAREAYIAALVAGTATYDAVERPGRPLRLRLRGLRSPAPTYDENGAQAGTQRVLVQHGCTGATYPPAVKPAADTGKAQAPATHGRGSAGSRPPVARVAGDGRSSVVRNVTPHLSDATNGGTESSSLVPVAASNAWAAQGDQNVPRDAPGARYESGKRQEWTSPTASAARSGPGQGGLTAPHATRLSAGTESPTSTGSAPTGLTGGAPTPRPSASYRALTGSGAAPRSTPRSARPGGVFRGGSNVTPNPPRPKVFAPVRCNTCDKLIDQTKPFAGIHHGRWVWAVHEECE